MIRVPLYDWPSVEMAANWTKELVNLTSMFNGKKCNVKKTTLTVIDMHKL